ncbi:Na+/H+ antiporter NhaC [Algicola sagamiensis]|uniref:Na+/H+ antiporter NhaC n=1 Tax=Algicola sagamiensis TaxID=163869 RepID=UPI00037A19A6|nr:Na+/H+ antiporter NhaC [Algicola sagamiensis]
MTTNRNPSLLDAIIPIISLIVMLCVSVILFGSDSSYGPNQIALLLAAGIGAIIGLKNGFKWEELEAAMVDGIKLSLGAVLILLAVGSLIGTWLLAGTVPTLIYYGLQILSPEWFYAASCILCAIVAMSIGSSWTTAATIGVALIGVAAGMDLSAPITAGAIISGAYFGDKLSPLSETTNLAPAVAGTKLFPHIQHMLWTTIPSFVTALVIFLILGLSGDTASDINQVDAYLQILDEKFNIGPMMLVPLVVLVVLAVKKMPAFPAVAIGAIVGAVWAVIFQGDMIQSMLASKLHPILSHIKIVWSTLFSGFSIETGNADLDSLLSGGGMANMMNTVWLIICAMTFGAVLEKVGLLRKFLEVILSMAKSTGSLITSTIATCIGTNIVSSDQYMSIVMPGRMFKEEYERRGLDNVNLSRTLEDGGTITSPLIPWNTCGAYMHSVLKVDPLEYLFFCFFNLINPVLAIIYAYIGFKILRIKPKSAMPKPEAEAMAQCLKNNAIIDRAGAALQYKISRKPVFTGFFYMGIR